MNIAWFTPFNKQSAIGRFSECVVRELAKVATVDLCHFEQGEVRSTPVPVRRFIGAESVTERDLARYDMVVYNFGNHLPFHREIFLLSQRHAGLCILHDFSMHHFFAAFYLEELKSQRLYVSSMERFYGDEGARMAKEGLDGRGRGILESEEIGRFPLFEATIPNALGVVAHSEFFASRVRAAFPGPVRRIPLAYEIDRISPVPPRQGLGIEDDRVLLITVGHVNPNKQIASVIEALGDLRLASDRLEYAVLGLYSPGHRRELEAIASRCGVSDCVRFLGEVSDETMRAYLTHADICVNLRFPTIEGASASIIEEMLFGKAVVVTNAGYFHELPDACVVKVGPGQKEELVCALRSLITDAPARTKLGAAAQRFAQQEFRAEHYSRALLEFVWEIHSASPLLNLADRFGQECSRMGVDSTMQIVPTIADEIYKTFCKEPN